MSALDFFKISAPSGVKVPPEKQQKTYRRLRMSSSSSPNAGTPFPSGLPAPSPRSVFISASNGDGIDELTSAVENITGAAGFDENSAVISNERQYQCVLNAEKPLEQAAADISAGITLDAVTVLIEEAIQNLLELTGERAGDTIVHSVFSKFCVGK